MGYRLTEASLARRIANGRGQGIGDEYTPFIRIHEIPSRGVSFRYVGWKTGRVHHLLSLNELRYFMVLEWADTVLDIREQYPLLPMTSTQAIAAEMSVRHPRVPQGPEVPLTSDFVLTVQSSPMHRPVTVVRTIKPRADLRNRRVREKLEIERRWWAAQAVDWKIVPDDTIPKVFAANVAWLHGWRNPADLPLDRQALPQILEQLALQAPARPSWTLLNWGQYVDRRWNFEPGTGMAVIRHLLATKRWVVDMDIPMRPGRRRPHLANG